MPFVFDLAFLYGFSEKVTLLQIDRNFVRFYEVEIGMRIVIAVLILMVILCGVILSSCEDLPSNYTVEQHKERISAKIETHFTRSHHLEWTSYEIYPLYDDKEELTAFIIEFEPTGHVFIELSSEPRYIGKNVANSMYHYDDSYLMKQYGNLSRYGWRRYRICLDGNEPEQGDYKWLADPKDSNLYANNRYEVNSNSEFIEYTCSPYKAANVLNERLYCLNLGMYAVSAIKKDGKYFNLISMEEMEYNEGGEEYYKELYTTGNIDNYIPCIFWCPFIKDSL